MPLSGLKKPPLAIVAAVARNGAIGQGHKLPWRMPSDLARFRSLTMGKPIIMGRRTFDAIGRVLPGRLNIVVSSFDLDLPKGAARAGSPDHALELAYSNAATTRASEVMLIGGAVLFDDMLPVVDRLYLTFVNLMPKADAFFPAIDPYVWRETSHRTPPLGTGDEARCVFVDYARR